MGVKRIVDTDFWVDDKVLDFTVEDRYFMLYLLTNPQSRQLGAYKLPKKVMSFQIGYTMECVVNLLDRFQKNYKMLIYNNTTQEIAIKNYLKYSIVSGGKPVLDCIKKDISLITDKNLIGYVKVSLENIIAINSKPVYLDILDIIKDYKYNENQIYIHNENESIVPRFVDDSLEPPKNPATKPLSATSTKHTDEIINYFNLVCGTHYRTNTKPTLENINARLNEGFTVENFKTVINKKKMEWGNKRDMIQYLRPETLFCSKHFESYLNQQWTDGKQESETDRALRQCLQEAQAKGSEALMIDYTGIS